MEAVWHCKRWYVFVKQKLAADEELVPKFHCMDVLGGGSQSKKIVKAMGL